MFFLLVPVLTALAVIVVILPALVPGLVLIGAGWLAYHFVVVHRQHDRGLHPR